MTEAERDEYVEEFCQDELWEMIEWGWDEV